MRRRLKFEERVYLLALLGGLPAMAAALVLMAWSPLTAPVIWPLSLLLAGVWLGVGWRLRNSIVRPLQTISNLLAGLREEDFSTRARGARPDDTLGEVLLEINNLSEVLRNQRLGALEATALLRAVMEEIDLAVFTFDDRRKLRLVNRAGQRLLAQPSERLMDRTASELNLAECLQGDATRTVAMAFPSGMGRWGIRRSTFRQGGLPHQLLVITDLSRALREEERQAWQRLLRVLGHELNNSLAPIKSISGSLVRLIQKDPPPADWRDDLCTGLGVIESRSEALNRFIAAYSQLARLPQPRLQPLAIGPWLERIVQAETRFAVVLHKGPDAIVQGDSDQLEQLMINLLRNAVDAVLELEDGSATPQANQREVSISWDLLPSQLEIRILDSGPGLANSNNLFIPFFTTKAGGSGIGLVLSRQIAEAHGGSLTLENRKDTRGCIATLRLAFMMPDGENIR